MHQNHIALLQYVSLFPRVDYLPLYQTFNKLPFHLLHWCKRLLHWSSSQENSPSDMNFLPRHNTDIHWLMGLKALTRGMGDIVTIIGTFHGNWHRPSDYGVVRTCYFWSIWIPVVILPLIIKAGQWGQPFLFSWGCKVGSKWKLWKHKREGNKPQWCLLLARRGWWIESKSNQVFSEVYQSGKDISDKNKVYA